VTGPRPLRIGISACVFHEDPARTTFHGKPLYYVERGMAAFVASEGAVAYMVPEPATGAAFEAYARDLDGLVLAGGVDIDPRGYGEEPARPEWSGDAVRDAYELDLVRAMLAEDKPVLGICRGHQLLNVCFGGTLYQDVRTMIDGALVHRDADVYDELSHEIDIVPGSWLASVYGHATRARVNSVHHQAIKEPGRGVVVEARSTEDGVIEAMRVEGPRWVRGVQWHPEFSDPADERVLDRRPLLRAFLDAVGERRGG
jgi:putative glutamine amidotransferase